MPKTPEFHILTLDKIVGGGQTIGTLSSGKKALVWGGLPGENVEIRTTKKKSSYIEGVVTRVIDASPERRAPIDSDSYLSTSPWQIMSFHLEQRTKTQLIEEAFLLHGIVLPQRITVLSNETLHHYRNKVEFSWYSDVTPDGNETLDLAFFRRGSKGKIPIDDCSLLPDSMMALARAIRDFLKQKGVTARQLKTLLIRCDQRGQCVWQLYVKDTTFDSLSPVDATRFPALGGEVIYSDPRSPASRITKRLHRFGEIVLRDTILGTEFQYATEGFFQVNIPMYEQALRDMEPWVSSGKTNRTIDLYAGVGTIGLTIGGPNCTLIEINEHAVREMRENIKKLTHGACAVLSPSESALEHISQDSTVIVDPPRAGLHQDVVDRILDVKSPRIIYLSCNPVTQARDVSLLKNHYKIAYHRGYNFFPRTPHIEHLVVLDLTTENRISL